MDWLLWIYLVGTGIFWCIFYLKASRLSLLLPSVPTTCTHSKADLPKLSVIITAKDEANTIEHALQTILNTDYPDFEIIIVNDRSDDDTGKIIDTFAEQHPQIVPIHIATLPANWIGKVHALHTATAKAKGEWLLFTDADVHHHPTLWQRAIELATSKQCAHLALLPNVPTPGILLQACVKAFGLLFLTTAKVEHIEDPDKESAIGIGAFNLVNRAAFNRTPGFEWLRMEVADDYGIGIMMKKWGQKISFATAYDDLQVDWYPNVSSMIKGLEKNIMAPGTRFETLRLILSPLIFAAVILGPFISLLIWSGYYFLVGVCVSVCIVITSLWIPKSRTNDLSNWLLTPIGYLVILYTFTRACILCLVRNGIIWRNTYYPRALLRNYQRVKL
jgi:glycosyltransferase involved in cell wall biosynthesis